MKSLNESIKREMRNPTKTGLIITSLLIIFLSAVFSVIYYSFNLNQDPDPDTYIMQYIENPEAENVMIDHLIENPLDLEMINTLIYFRLIGEKSRVTSENYSQDPFLNRVKEITGINDSYIRTRIMSDTEGLENTVNELLKNPEDAYSNFLIGTLLREEQKDLEALTFFRKAETLGLESKHNKLSILNILLTLKWTNDLNEILTKEDYRSLCDNSCMLNYMILTRNYTGVIPHTILSEIENYQALIVIVSLLVGLGWYITLLHLGRGSEWKKSYLILSMGAVILGMISAHITVIAVVIEEQILGFDGYNYDLAGEVIYSILGIGLREELIKLICFLPIIPFIIKKSEKRFILTFASLVGLGFAIEENIGYYAAGGEAVTARFLTANFFHITLTGYCGYYLVEAFRKGGEHIGIFFTEFAKMTVLHGLYDFFLISSHITELSFLSMTIFIWLSGEYLGILTFQRYTVIPRVSLQFLFTAVLSLTVGAGFFLAVSMFGPGEAVFAILTGVLGNIIIAVMFFRYFHAGGN